jgi:hypothetical protein
MRRLCLLLFFTYGVSLPPGCRESVPPNSSAQPQVTAETLVTALFQAAAESDEDAVKQLLSEETRHQIEAVFAQIGEQGVAMGWQTFMNSLARIPLPECTKTAAAADENAWFHCVGLAADVTIHSTSEGGKRRLVLSVAPLLRSLTDTKN